jgi:hypothetical protein
MTGPDGFEQAVDDLREAVDAALADRAQLDPRVVGFVEELDECLREYEQTQGEGGE